MALEGTMGEAVRFPAFYKSLAATIEAHPDIDLQYAIREYIEVLGPDMTAASSPVGWFCRTFSDFLHGLGEHDALRRLRHERVAEQLQSGYEEGLRILDDLDSALVDRLAGRRSSVYIPNVLERLCGIGIARPVADRNGFVYQYCIGGETRAERQWVDMLRSAEHLRTFRGQVERFLESESMRSAPGTYRVALTQATRAHALQTEEW